MKRNLLFAVLVLVFGLGCAGLLIGLVAHQAHAMPAVPTWLQVNQDGFGEYQNQQVPSLESFGDYLYAGVWRYDPVTATAQIWRTSTGQDWEKVDDRVASGAADLIVYDGSIYAGSWDGVVWSSPNGITWTQIITGGFDGAGQGIAHFAVYSDTLYAGTWAVDGTEIWRTSNGTDWEPFVQDGLGDPNNGGAIASDIFNGYLYWGVLNIPDGAQIWRTDGITTTVVITGGFGITQNQSVSSLAVFGDNLYAGLWNSQVVQVWRSSNGLVWQQVLDGVGNPANWEINALEVYRGKLYLVLQCDETGLQVWRTANGTDWEQVGFDGFGDGNNQLSYWDNGTTVFKDKLYVATNNFATGGEVWQMTGDIYKSYLPVVSNNYPIIETGKIVFVSNRDGNDEIYSMNYDGSGVTRLTSNSSEDLNPDWSPDGTKITFLSDRSGESEIYVMNWDGSGQTQVTTMTHCYSPQWSLDGTRIAFYTRQSNNNIIYTMDPDGSDLFQVTDPAMSGYDPYWSPDGLRIAFYSTRTTAGIYVIDADGTDQSLLLASSDIVYFAWSPDGTRMALSKTVTPGYNFDLFVYDINTGVTTRLTNTQFNHNFVDWSPEGYHLIFSSNRDDISNFEIYSMTSYGDYITNISNNPAGDAEPDWVK